MKWGVRRFQNKDGSLIPKGKARYSSDAKEINLKQKGVSINSDGSMSISKGTNIQRLSRRQSTSLGSLTYASVIEYDNAKYIKYIGGKGIFGGGRDTILLLQAKEDLKAPSVTDASRIMVNLLKSDSKFRNGIADVFTGAHINNDDFKKMVDDPTGDTAKAWYTILNSSLIATSATNPSASYIKEVFSEALQKNGYNLLRDENDFEGGVSKAPLIVLNPEKTLSVVNVADITDELRNASKETLREYKNLGKDWCDKYVYDR